MPIHCPVTLGPVSDLAFESVDRRVMGESFAAHNHLGRLCDERVYENDVAARLRAGGVTNVATQVPVTLTHCSFLKVYRLDLVVDSVIYELKSTDRLAPDHEAQAIHYAALGDADRAKLVNFGASRVAGRLLRTPFSETDRRRISVVKERWHELSRECVILAKHLISLGTDWGAYLEAGLYQEALVHLFGGEPKCRHRLPVSRDGIELGTHWQACHGPEVGFVVTALTRDTAGYEEHLQRLLNSLPLEGIQWLNWNHAELQMVTLRKQQ